MESRTTDTAATGVPQTVNGTLPSGRGVREDWHPPGAPERTYVLEPLTLIERPRVAEAVKADVGEYPTDEMTNWATREAALRHLAPEDAARACQTLEELAALEKGGDKADLEVQEVLANLTAAAERLRMRLSWKDAELREVNAARAAWVETWFVYTARAVIRDWSGLEGPCARRRVGQLTMVTEEAMRLIPEDDLRPLLARCHDWTEVTAAQEPGSASL